MNGFRNNIVAGDCLEVLRTVPTGTFRLTITSPPYEDARTYGIGFKHKGQDWVDWMLPRVLEMCRCTEGLVLINAAGKVRQFSYSPSMEWLVADLTRNHGVVCGPAPYVFHRVGIPGSGGPHYHRRDWEPVYAFALPECLPPKWSDNTCMGHPPKWAPGGEMSNRQSDGSRVNKWGHSGRETQRTVDGELVQKHATKLPPANSPSSLMRSPASNRQSDGSRKVNGGRRDQWGGTGHETSGNGRKPNGDYKTRKKTFEEKTAAGAKIHTKHDGAEADMREQVYLPPVLANPGNVIKCLVGGGVMGDSLAHENEAPFPESLVEFFVRSYCEEGAIVCDPFSGSGTTAKVAQRWGRAYFGIDVRESQVKLAKKRLRVYGAPLLEQMINGETE